MTFPVWVRDGRSKKPETDVFYEVASNGIFIHKKMKFWEAVVPVERISILEKGAPSLKIALPPIPKEIVRELARFFAWVAEKYGTEAAAILWYKPEDKSYRVSIPYQRPGPASLWYEVPRSPAGEFPVGTFHSHVRMSAFHSSTDQCDEESFDGIHATFGNFDQSRHPKSFSISIQAAVNGQRFTLDPLSWLGGVKEYLNSPEKPKVEVKKEAKVTDNKNKACEEASEIGPRRETSSVEVEKPEGLLTYIVSILAWFFADSEVKEPNRATMTADNERKEKMASEKIIPVVKEEPKGGIFSVFSVGSQRDKMQFCLDDDSLVIPDNYTPPAEWDKNLDVGIWRRNRVKDEAERAAKVQEGCKPAPKDKEVVRPRVCKGESHPPALEESKKKAKAKDGEGLLPRRTILSWFFGSGDKKVAKRKASDAWGAE